MGFRHIEELHAAAINKCHREHLNPYFNFHRPCGVPIYPWYATPGKYRSYRIWPGT